MTQEQRASIIRAHKQENGPPRHQMGEERRSVEVGWWGGGVLGEDKKDDRKPNILHAGGGGGGGGVEGRLEIFFYLFIFLFLQGKLTYGSSRFSHSG